MARKTMNIPLFLCFLVCLDTVGIGAIVMQLLPRGLVLGATPFQNGLIAAIYGAGQLFSSSIMGKLGDRLNRRNLMIAIMLICSCNYYLLGFSSLLTFIISRLISGLIKHTQLLMMACLSDIATPEEKVKYFGFYGAGIGIGFIIGPVIGGFLAELPNGFSWMCAVTSLFFLLSAALVWAFLPNIEHKQIAKDDKKAKHTSSGIRGIMEKAGIEDCWDVLLLQGLTEFSVMIYFNNFMFETESEYGLTPKHMGIFMAAFGIAGTAVSLVAGKIERFINGENAVPYLIGLMLISYAVISFKISFTLYCIMLGVMNTSVSLLRCWWTSMATSRSSPEKSGAVVGATHTQMAITGMIAPILTGTATEVFGSVRGPNYMAVLVCLIALICCQWYPKPIQKLKAN